MPARSASSVAHADRTWSEGDAAVKKSVLEADPSSPSAYAEVVAALGVCGSLPYVAPGGMVTADSPWGPDAADANVDAPRSTRPCSPPIHAALFVKLGTIHLARRNRSAARSAFFVASAFDRRSLDEAGVDAGPVVTEALAQKPPSVTLGAITSTGKPSEKDVRDVIERHMADLRGCYAVGLTLRPSLSGRLGVTLMVDGAGDASVDAEGDIGEGWVRTCVARTLSRLPFPPSGGGGTAVRVPIVLTPGR